MENKLIGIVQGSTLLITAILLTATIACKKAASDSTTGTTTTTIGTGVPDIYKKIYGATSITTDGTYITIKATSLPDHKSPYYKGTQWAATLYEAYNGTNPLWSQNPNSIAENDVTYKIPLNPTVASTHSATPLGPMGVALNGVPIFNQYAAGGAALTGEVNSFDEYDGHPQQSGMYHYHAEPYYLTTKNGESSLIGFLLDGFPVYGPMENGKTLTNADLDVYHGHTSATADYPNGIYHYHITSAAPYINGNGFYGTAGTVSQ
ncbi:YHYH protein [uncultured Mucilaginibacter sp.]|uniref:YHYH protein n=1 Tax=uncultured Mucilaginibacter sp. TaxID=797541 RepID=UPI0025D0CE22|nr:YHYH protein [uncultured Mucilaginibacter sp.]